MDYSTSSVFVTPGVCAVDKTYDTCLVHSPAFSFKQVQLLTVKEEGNFFNFFFLTTGLGFKYICWRSLHLAPESVLIYSAQYCIQMQQLNCKGIKDFMRGINFLQAFFFQIISAWCNLVYLESKLFIS